MTQRERQLLEWIRENPMISQQELADKAGITRSSVAVHISNLMKKGCITGKGYIVRTAPYVAVVGGVNMDIGAVSAGKLVARDSNPGHVTTSLGGVGRNIAHNLCLLGQQTAMVTVMGDDDFGRRVQENARDIGLDLSASAVLPDCRTGTYLYIAGPDGDMALAVNDMDIYQRMTPDFLRQRLDFINGADLVVLETNLPEDSIRWLCDNCRAPILADPVSTIKAEKLRPVLGKLAALKPNRLEAELLSGMSIRTPEDAAQAARACWTPAWARCTSPWARRASMPPTGRGVPRGSPVPGAMWSTPPAAETPWPPPWPPGWFWAIPFPTRPAGPWAQALWPARQKPPSTRLCAGITLKQFSTGGK